jgi:hypothetical protein
MEAAPGGEYFHGMVASCAGTYRSIKPGADQWRRQMKNLVLAGALLAVLVSPAFAEDPYSKTDPYESNAKHLDAAEQSAQVAPLARSSRSAQSTVGLSNTNDGPKGEVIRNGEVVGQDPDPSVRSMIGQGYDEHGGHY